MVEPSDLSGHNTKHSDIPCSDPKRFQYIVKTFDTIRVCCLRQGGNGQACLCPDFALVVLEAYTDTVYQTFEVRKNSTAHHDRNLLNDSAASMSCLPGLFTSTHCSQEWKKGRYAESLRNNGESSSGSVAYVLIYVVNIGSHCTDHVSETSSLAKIGDDFLAFHPCIIVLIDQEWFNHDQDLMHMRPNQFIKLVKNAVDDFDQQMSLLVL